MTLSANLNPCPSSWSAPLGFLLDLNPHGPEAHLLPETLAAEGGGGTVLHRDRLTTTYLIEFGTPFQTASRAFLLAPNHNVCFANLSEDYGSMTVSHEGNEPAILTSDSVLIQDWHRLMSVSVSVRWPWWNASGRSHKL